MCTNQEDTLQKKFEAIACKAYKEIKGIKENISFSDIEPAAKTDSGRARKCEDQYIAQIEIRRSNEGEVTWLTEKSKIMDRSDAENIENIDKESLKTIALILESPHIAEFWKDEKNKIERETPCPAMGNTGKHIVEAFPEILLKYMLLHRTDKGAITNGCRDIESDTYRLKLINTVQYQCSLGEPTDNYRDDIFAECIGKKEFKEDFKKRIKDCDPQIIINCCTTGNKKSNFNSEVQKIINENFSNTLRSNTLRLKGYHPASSYFFIGFEKVT